MTGNAGVTTSLTGLIKQHKLGIFTSTSIICLRFFARIDMCSSQPNSAVEYYFFGSLSKVFHEKLLLL